MAIFRFRSTSDWRAIRLLPIACVGLFVGFLDSPVLAETVETRSRSLHAARASITQGELRNHVSILADDTFEGREAGARGGHAAGGYLVKHLQQLGFQPAGDNGSYYQSFNGSCRNVLALLEGSDPQLKHEVVVVGAHYDHVGYGTRRNSYGPWGYIHNGADDNASGTAGLLEVAQALCELPEPPRRTILLAFWDAEEKGLLGSKHWVASPTIAWSRLKCFVNVDMIGRLTNRRVEVYGTRSGAGLRQIVSRANSAGLDLDFTWEMKDDSDHWPFFAQGLPVLMLHTGLHEDYHRPSDDVERLNHEGLEQVSRMLFEATYALANAQAISAFRPESRRETNDVRRIVEQPGQAPPARLGMTWRKEATDGDQVTLRVLSINPGSAAETAGIRAGDFVTHLDEVPISDDLLFRQQILAAPASITLTVGRSDEPAQNVLVKLQGSPIRIGVTCREDIAEPGVAIVTHVVYGSPAAVTGLQVGDRIEAVEGRSFQDLREFYQLIDQARDTITLRRERRGQIQDVLLKLLSVGPPAP